MSEIQKYGKATKRLDRFAPNLAHMCRFFWEWISTKHIYPSDNHRGHLGVLVGHQFRNMGKLLNGWTDWRQMCHTSPDSSGNGL